MAPRGLGNTEWEWMEMVEELVHNRQDTLDTMLCPLPLMCVCKHSIILGQSLLDSAYV